MTSVNLVERFQLYSSWRFALGQAITRFRDWMTENGITDVPGTTRIQRILDRLADDKLSIAFVAEFSRGKSELINAIFFADYGRRILPSSAGRTTMFPTEHMYNDGEPSELRLLPIETRAKAASVADYKQYPDEWISQPLDTSSGDAMFDAFRQVSLVKRVRVSIARRYGLFDEKDPDARAGVAPDGTVEIPAWRHAMINFPHPLLAQGLVILDTPGLNAIGAEPELTLNLIPNAHAVLFILAADTGVTKSDIQIWREHIAASAPGTARVADGGTGLSHGRMVVLNKIDSMWDELKTQAEIDAEIDSQVRQVAATLNLQVENVFPISAQKGLVAKVQDDAALLAKSRLPLLETALSHQIIPSKQEIVREFVTAESRNIIGAAQALLASRVAGVKEQLGELTSLQGKNEDVTRNMLDRMRVEKERFEKGLLQFSATRSVLDRSTNSLFTHLGMEGYHAHVAKTREAINAAALTAGMLESMRGFFIHGRQLLQTSNRMVAEITDMMEAMYRKFSADFGLTLAMPQAFSMARYLKELDRVEDSFNRRFGAMTLITNYHRTLTRRFFDVIASRIQIAFEIANRDTEGWLRAVMNPLEAQIKDRQRQMRKRLDSLKRIHMATDTLEDRIAELAESEKSMITQVMSLDNLRQEIEAMLEQNMLAPMGGPTGFDLSL